MTHKPLKVCYFGTYRAHYSRNVIMQAGLEQVDVEVIRCHVSLWKSIEDRVQTAQGGWLSLAFIKRLAETYAELLKKYFALRGDYDVMVLGYPGQLDTFLARLLSWYHGKPLVLDVLMSIYLVAVERNLNQEHRLSITLLRALEWIAYRLPDRLICDTPAYRSWHGQVHGLHPDRFRLLSMGVDDRIFQPLTRPPHTDDQFRVLYYGTFIPNHGVETIIEAARCLQSFPNIQFELVGDGPQKQPAEQLAALYQLTNVHFTGWIDKSALSPKIVQADLVCGVFGDTPQSLMTIHNKIYEALMMQKTVVSGDSLTIRQQFQHGEHLYLIPRKDGRALAQSIVALKTNPSLRDKMARQGHDYVSQYHTIAKLGQTFRRHLEEVVG